MPITLLTWIDKGKAHRTLARRTGRVRLLLLLPRELLLLLVMVSRKRRMLEVEIWLTIALRGLILLHRIELILLILMLLLLPR